MRILVVSATELEIGPFMTEHRHADVLITGVGVPAAIYHLQKRLHQIDYDFVLQAGICGTLDPDYSLCSSVIVQKDCFADLGVENYPGVESVFDLNLADPSQFPFDNGWLINNNQILREYNLKTVNGITVNTIHTKKDHLDFFRTRFEATIESMEGAAFHYVCLQENVEFMQLRNISNVAGIRDKSQWMIRESIEQLNKDLSLLYDSIQKKTPGQ